VDRPNDITRLSIPHGNIHTAVMVTVIAEELGNLWEGVRKKLLALCPDSMRRVLCLSRENAKLLAAKNFQSDRLVANLI